MIAVISLGKLSHLITIPEYATNVSHTTNILTTTTPQTFCSITVFTMPLS